MRAIPHDVPRRTPRSAVRAALEGTGSCDDMVWVAALIPCLQIITGGISPVAVGKIGFGLRRCGGKAVGVEWLRRSDHGRD